MFFLRTVRYCRACFGTRVCLPLLIAGDDKSEAGLLGSVSKILGTPRIQFKNPCGGEKNTGSLWSEQGE